MTECIRDHYELCLPDQDGAEQRADENGVTWWGRKAPADKGLLCRKCWGRMRWMLEQAPQLLAHMQSLKARTPSVNNNQRVSGSSKEVLPFREDIVEDIDELYPMLTRWAVSFARTLKLAPPASLVAAFEKDRDIPKVPAWLSGPGTATLTKDVIAWFLLNQNMVLHQPAVTVFFDDLEEHLAGMLHRYPQAPRRERGPARLCPQCGETTLRALYAANGDKTITCYDPDARGPYKGCGFVVDPTEMSEHEEERETTDA